MKHWLKFGMLLLALLPAQAFAAKDKPLFDSSDVLHLVIRGPISHLERTRSEQPQPGTVSIAGSSDSVPVRLSVRGHTRSASDICDFPPIRIDFDKPPATSMFAGQKKLKLVTHCRAAPGFQQYLLLEYTAYHMFNLLSPLSFRVRLVSVDYVDPDGKPLVSRYGFLLEDASDVARRNGLHEAHLQSMFPVSALSPRHAALYAMFEDMIGNHDWSMRAGPAGTDCCHNAKLAAPNAKIAAAVVPIPYDFDYSGLVNTPYAEPPAALNLSSVRDRLYRGYCADNADAVAVAAEIRAKHDQILATLSQTPDLDERHRRDAAAYLEGFFAEIATDADVRSKVLRTCV